MTLQQGAEELRLPEDIIRGTLEFALICWVVSKCGQRCVHVACCICRAPDLSTFVDFSAVYASLAAIVIYLVVSFCFFTVSDTCALSALHCSSHVY